jgi:hypothetical protein
MTEDDAKTKVCPIAKMRSATHEDWDNGLCIGSKCMMWRIQRTLTGDITGRGDVDDTHGFCGLAGYP